MSYIFTCWLSKNWSNLSLLCYWKTCYIYKNVIIYHTSNRVAGKRILKIETVKYESRTESPDEQGVERLVFCASTKVFDFVTCFHPASPRVGSCCHVVISLCPVCRAGQSPVSAGCGGPAGVSSTSGSRTSCCRWKENWFITWGGI